MMQFIKEYWFLITFLMTQVGIIYKVYKSQKTAYNNTVEAAKCSLRNDILDIYDRAVARGKKITLYELEAIIHSSEVYFKLRGNSFVKNVIETVNNFEKID